MAKGRCKNKHALWSKKIGELAFIWGARKWYFGDILTRNHQGSNLDPLKTSCLVPVRGMEGSWYLYIQLLAKQRKVNMSAGSVCWLYSSLCKNVKNLTRTLTFACVCVCVDRYLWSWCCIPSTTHSVNIAVRNSERAAARNGVRGRGLGERVGGFTWEVRFSLCCSGLVLARCCKIGAVVRPTLIIFGLFDRQHYSAKDNTNAGTHTHKHSADAGSNLLEGQNTYESACQWVEMHMKHLNGSRCT